ncbi:MAG: hypothetical protein AAF720_13110 [Pseudomonadota bacterium]
MADINRHILRFVVSFVGLATILLCANIILHGGEVESATGRAVVGGGIGAGVFTVYLTIRKRIREAISAMGANASHKSAETEKSGDGDE